MRILAGCDWFSPSTGGGAERVAWEVYQRLAKQGHQVTVVATAPDEGSFGEVAPEGGLQIIPVPARDLSGVLGVQASAAIGLSGAFKRALLRVRPDVIHANSLQFQTTPVAGRLAARTGLPFVITAHIGSLEQVPGLVGTAARLHERIFGRRALCQATRAIAVSDAVRQHLSRLAPNLPIDVVENGVDLDRFLPEPARVRTRGGPIQIGFVGRLVANKGPETALRAFGEVRARGIDAQLHVAGDGPQRTRLERLVGAFDARGDVRFLGHIAEPASLLRDLDILVRPSLTEGMPLGLLEAMAAQVAVVASDIPGNESLVTDGESGLLVPPRDVGALAAAIARLAQDDGLRLRLAAAGRRRVITRTWEACAAGTLATLQRAIDTAARRSLPIRSSRTPVLTGDARS